MTNDRWIAAVFASADRRDPVGCGVLIDRRRVLTCWHVVAGRFGPESPLIVAFPAAGLPRTAQIEVTGVRAHVDGDVAILELAEPAPPGAAPAPLRSPRPAALRGGQWRAAGLSRDSGAEAYGTVGVPLAYGWVQLETRSRHLIRTGFGGAALWSRDFEAVVGLVGQAQAGGPNAGDPQAVTLHQIARDLPGEKLHELTSWSTGPAADSGRFRGRTAALAAIVKWLTRPRPDAQVLVVTGAPGAGKSAVLGRIITTAGREARAALPPGDLRAPAGSIACAVLAKGKTALDVAVEIARAASVRIPRTVDDLVPTLHKELSQNRRRTRFTIIVDGLDEAAGPEQARLIVAAVLLPIARTCARFGAQVVIGSRRQDDGGDLTRAFGPDAGLIDLDQPAYFDKTDLEEYAAATLAPAGDERPGNPYTDPATAAPVAKRIAALAGRNFLIAGLIARSHGLSGDAAADPGTLAKTTTVDDALAEYLRRLPPIDGVPAGMLLTALAYAQPPGLSMDLWRLALEAMDITVSGAALGAFAGSPAATFLVESGDDPGTSRFRLSHQALNDSLRRGREAAGRRETDESAIAQRFLAHGRAGGWRTADPYLLRSLPAYAARAGMIDSLLADDGFLLHADLTRLTQPAAHAATSAGIARARILRLTPDAITAPPAERAALFGVTAELERLGGTFPIRRGVPYRARWASVPTRAERSVLDGHAGTVWAICAVTVGGQPHLATVGNFPFIRLWNPANGRHWEVPIGPAPARDEFYTVCAVAVEGRTLIAAGGRSGRIHFVDPVSRRPAGTLKGPDVPIYALSTLTVGPLAFLLSGGQDGLVRMWNLADGRARAFEGHQGPVRVVAAIRSQERQLILSAGDDRQARIWDPAHNRPVRVLSQHVDIVRAACPLSVGGRSLLATTNYTDAKLWDSATGRENRILHGHRKPIRGMTTIAVRGSEVLATASADGDVRIWNPGNGECLRVLTGHTDSINSICAVAIDQHVFLATAGRDRTARLWDLAAADIGRGRARPVGRVRQASAIRVGTRQLVATVDGNTGTIRLQDAETGAERAAIGRYDGSVNSMCVITDRGFERIATASDGRVLQTWDPHQGRQLLDRGRRLEHLQAICAFRAEDGSELLALAGDRRGIQFCQPATGRVIRRTRLPAFSLPDHVLDHLQTVRVISHVTGGGLSLLATAGDNVVMLWDSHGHHRAGLDGHRGAVGALATVTVNGRPLLATAGEDQTIRIWDPRTYRCEHILTGHTDGINSLCSVTVHGRALLASAGRDRTVKVWDPVSGSLEMSIPVHYPALTCVEVSGVLFVGLTAGSMALDLNVRDS